MTTPPRFGVVLLTMGSRPNELATAVRSALDQEGVVVDVVVVGNGWQPTGLPDGVHLLGLPENVGAPAGRNAGVPHVSGELLFFLDDDAELPTRDFLARIAAVFAAEPDVALIQPRVVDPEGRPSPRRWTPRLRVGDPTRSSDVTSVWEGAVAARRDLFERVGGWPEKFWWGHEGIDLAWAMWDADARVRYAGDIVVHHPAVSATRHDFAYRVIARNRIWLARRRLPLPLAAVYLTVWTLLTAARVHSSTGLRQSWRGVVEGFREDPGLRRPMRWRTVLRLTKAGRPPVI